MDTELLALANLLVHQHGAAITRLPAEGGPSVLGLRIADPFCSDDGRHGVFIPITGGFYCERCYRRTTALTLLEKLGHDRSALAPLVVYDFVRRRGDDMDAYLDEQERVCARGGAFGVAHPCECQQCHPGACVDVVIAAESAVYECSDCRPGCEWHRGSVRQLAQLFNYCISPERLFDVERWEAEYRADCNSADLLH